MEREFKLLEVFDRFSARGPLESCVAFVSDYEGAPAWEQFWQPLVLRYGLRHPVAVVDERACDPGPTLAAHVLRVRAQGRFRPQVVLATRSDAVLLLHGSFDLTRRGLGAARELVTALEFSRDVLDARPRVLQSALAFLSKHVSPLLRAAHDESRALVDEALLHARWIADALPRNAGLDGLDFIHTGDGALWPQVFARLSDDTPRRLTALGPLRDADPGSGVDDGAWLRAVLSTFTAPKPATPVKVFASGTGSWRACVPADLAQRVACFAQDYGQQPTTIRGRAVHLEGASRHVLAWGSADPTTSGMLWDVSRKQFEAAWVLVSPELDREFVATWLELDTSFARTSETETRPASTAPVPTSIGALTEIVYDPGTRELYLGARNLVAGTVVEVLEDPGERIVCVSELHDEHIEEDVVRWTFAAPEFETIDTETQRRRLRCPVVRVRAKDPAGQPLLDVRVRVNVRYDDVIEVFENLLLLDEAVRPDELLIPMTGASEARFKALEARLSWVRRQGRDEPGERSTHRAQLDQFFDNVHRGLALHHERLVQSKGALHLVLRWSRDLQRSLHALTNGADLDAARVLFLVTRVSAQVHNVLKISTEWNVDRQALAEALEAGRLRRALLDGCARVRGIEAVFVHHDLEAVRAVCKKLEKWG